ncbi:MAG: radical SAM protein, partial [Sphingomicrobium sp.]
LVLTNAMRPMRRFEEPLDALRIELGARLTMRVSLDHYTEALHEAERGRNTWSKAIDGCKWLSDHGFRTAIAGRRLAGESEDQARAGYADLFAGNGLQIDALDPAALVLFPEMDVSADIPEISEACWGILDVSPATMMCASSRMVVKHRGSARPTVVACTLIPYDNRFALGETLAGARKTISLNHPHCARFCVLGGASCSG